MVTVMGRRAIVHAAAWVLTTSAAVTLSWFGVHTVLAGTQYEPPRSLPITEGSSTTGPGSPSPQQPEPPPSKSKPSPSPKPRPPKSKPDSGSGEHTKPPSQPPEPGGKVASSDVAGGRAVFDMRKDYATLVSATPNDGWETQVRKDSTSIRVTFSKEGASSFVLCRWDDGPPRIESFN
jgi:hypothetical protein